MFGVSTIISAGISAVQSWINHKKDLRDAALEAADSLKKENETINDNISKIKELREKLADGTTTEQEAYDARKQLIDIQSELHDSYSKELDGIDLVNGGLEEQLDLLRKIQKEKAKNYVIENSDAIGNAREKINKNDTYLFDLKISEADKKGSSDNFANLNKYVDDYLTQYAKKHDNVKFYDGRKGTSASGVKFAVNPSIYAPVKEQFEIWQGIYDEIEKYGKENSVDVADYLSQVSKKLSDLNDKYGNRNSAVTI